MAFLDIPELASKERHFVACRKTRMAQKKDLIQKTDIMNSLLMSFTPQ